ncbi:hypothetical protein N7447_010662 [Penicillium robsamsonii]|uniref:uncharacterized protein n=1 Tax=Penicillium robsamsonii TaxID=1792511 RepID=UPI0025483890|nr:uncharacterized protein N7447_010662 [Penicillium robsamsonii]KAJ5811146.1 hypothetical protein N7447_010662 [Penicillium robsamsonii]
MAPLRWKPEKAILLRKATRQSPKYVSFPIQASLVSKEAVGKGDTNPHLASCPSLRNGFHKLTLRTSCDDGNLRRSNANLNDNDNLDLSTIYFMHRQHHRPTAALWKRGVQVTESPRSAFN